MTSKEYIDSGILEQYVLGIASASERQEVERMAAAHPVIRQEINDISVTLEKYAMANAVQPNPVIRPMLMATVNYSERLKNSEPFSMAPFLHRHSTPKDYATWLNRSDMSADDSEDLSAKIISYTPEVLTAIVWIKKYAPQEVHDKEYERFLIVEGTCDIIVEDEINHLVAGDFFEIPLFKKHAVEVTSSIPCKVILQRVAA